MNELKNIYFKFKTSSIVEKLIILNGVFFIVALLGKSFFIKWLALDADSNLLILKPWSLISYAFIHVDFFHLLSNLLILYYIGNFFITFFDKSQLLYLYFYGIISGSVLFLIVSYFIPSNTILIGASAAVTAIFVAVATKIPHYQIRLLLFGDVKMWVLAAIWVALSLLQLSSTNYGGAVAHLGGAIMGFSYVHFNLNNLNKFFLNKKTTKKKYNKSNNLKTIYKKSSQKNSSENSLNQDKQAKINVILDKISKSGYDSLTEEEKSFLFNQGK